MRLTIPRNNKVVRATTNRKGEVVLVMKSPCRHYSSVTLKADQGTVEIKESKKRCGLSGCMTAII